MSGGGLTGLATGFNRADWAPDRLVARNQHLIHIEKITLAATTVALARGTLLGRTRGATVPTSGTADGDNTGGGTLASVTGGEEVRQGTYTAVATTGGTTARFNIIAPDGRLVGVAVTGTAFVSTEINLTLSDGSPNFAIGDSFTIEVTGGGQFKTAVPTATDGSHEPIAVLNRDAPISTATQDTTGIFRGDLNPLAMTFGDGYDADAVGEALLARGITLVSASAAEER